MVEELNIDKCEKCNQHSIIGVDAGKKFLCAKHFVEQEDEECLKSFVKSDIDENGKITFGSEIQKEIKIQKPKIYDSFEMYFKE